MDAGGEAGRIWYLKTSEGSAGPYPTEELRAWRDEGAISEK